eukprot:1256276-Amorphochlora_amoeboformis.AAC.2
MDSDWNYDPISHQHPRICPRGYGDGEAFGGCSRLSGSNLISPELYEERLGIGSVPYSREGEE